MKRRQRRIAAATALGIELNGKPMHELRALLEQDVKASERYAALVGRTFTPAPTPEAPAPEAPKADSTPKPAPKPAPAPKAPARTTRANPSGYSMKPTKTSGKVKNVGGALADALKKANAKTKK